jgi:hypothetical protein
MKRRFVVSAFSALLLGSACSAPKDQSIIVTQARAPGTECEFTDATIYVEGGQVDMAAFGPASSFYQVFGWENDLQDISVTVGGQQITSNTPNTFIATAIQDSYVLVNGTNPPTGFVNISATIAPGGTPITNTVGVFLLTTEAAQAICGVPLGTDNCPGVPIGFSKNLLVTFQLIGTLVGGGSAATNPVTFPITLFNSGNTMPNPASPDTEPWICASGNPQVDTCGVPGRTITYCPGP